MTRREKKVPRKSVKPLFTRVHLPPLKYNGGFPYVIKLAREYTPKTLRSEEKRHSLKSRTYKRPNEKISDIVKMGQSKSFK